MLVLRRLVRVSNGGGLIMREEGGEVESVGLDLEQLVVGKNRDVQQKQACVG